MFTAIQLGLFLMHLGVKKGTFVHDFREAGNYSLECNSGAFCSGMYMKIVPLQAVQFSWKSVGTPGATVGETMVTVTLTDKGANCDLAIEHAGLDEGKSYDEHLAVWQATLNAFAEQLRRTAKTREYPISTSARFSFSLARLRYRRFSYICLMRPI